MSDLEKFERTGKLGLIGVFSGSCLLSLSFILLILYSWNHFHEPLPYQKAFAIGVLSVVAVMAAFAAWRHVALKRFAERHPSLRVALKDERVRFNWLKAYRPAFFVLLTVQVLSKLPILVWRVPWEVPFQSHLSLSGALATLLGAFFFYDRERQHE
jgi:hypothetical protein